MKLVVCAVSMLVVASSCTRPSATETGAEPTPLTATVATSPAVAPASSAAPVAADDGCDRAPPSTWLEVGTSSTVVMAQEPLTVTILAEPDVVCSGGSTSVAITIHNDGTSPIAIASLRLMLGSEGMWKWDLATLSSVALEVGQSAKVVTTAQLPLVRPGKYTLFLYGYAGGSDLTVAAPTGA